MWHVLELGRIIIGLGCVLAALHPGQHTLVLAAGGIGTDDNLEQLEMAWIPFCLAQYARLHVARELVELLELLFCLVVIACGHQAVANKGAQTDVALKCHLVGLCLFEREALKGIDGCEHGLLNMSLIALDHGQLGSCVYLEQTLQRVF